MVPVARAPVLGRFRHAARICRFHSGLSPSSISARWQLHVQLFFAAATGTAAVLLPANPRRTRCHTDSLRPTITRGDGSLAAAEQLINNIYRGIDPSQGPMLSAEEEDTVDESGGSHIYGEITVCGVHHLIHWLLQRSAGAPASAPYRLPEAGWTFVDLGSGVGRMCIQMAYMAPAWGCTRSVGIELSHTRHVAAVAAAERARQAGALHHHCSLEIIEGDILQEPLDGMTVVYVASLLFEDEMLDRLATRLEASQDVQWVATLRRFDPGRLRTLQLDAKINVPMSWDEDAEIFLYCRDRRRQLPDFASASGMSAEEAETRAFFA